MACWDWLDGQGGSSCCESFSGIAVRGGLLIDEYYPGSVMRREYRQVLTKIFERKMSERFKDFVPSRRKSDYIWPGERTFERQLQNETIQWVVLSPSEKDESFNVEVGWSRKNRFPALDMRPSPIPIDRALEEEEYLCRLGRLTYGSDYWWVIESSGGVMDFGSIGSSLKRIPDDTARDRVEPKVEDALHALHDIGLPFLDKACGESSRLGGEELGHE